MRNLRIPALLLALVFVASCDNQPPALQSALAARVDYYISDPDTAKSRLLQELRVADSTVEVALSSLTDDDLANALITARDNGANVRVVSDVDAAGDSGFQLLESEGIEVVYGDGELRYLPDPNLGNILDRCGYATDADKVICPAATPIVPYSARQILRPSEYNQMTHNFIIIGAATVWNFASPQFGDVDSIPLAWRFESELVKESYWREFNQLHSEVFASKLSIYNGPVKSSTQWNQSYLTPNGEVSMRFSPQERTVKSIIDDVYRARGNVWVMTDSISEDFLVDALEYKQNAGFDVRIVVNANAQDPEQKSRLDDLGARYTTDDVDYLPSIVAIDTEGTKGSRSETQRIHITSHPLFRTGPFRVIASQPNDRVEVYKSDYFTDGNTWTVKARPNQENPVLNQIKAGWEQVWERAQTDGGN